MSFWRVGTSVLALTAAGAVTATIIEGGGGGNPAYSITFEAVTQPTPMWPETRWVKANVSGPGVPTPGTYFDEQTAQWNFVWTELEPTSAWQHYTGPLSWLSDARVLYGRWCAHCPSTMGAQAWRCFAYNMNDWSQWTTAVYTFNVVDPATQFTSAQTYVVSPTSNWGVFPAHDVGNRFTSWDAVAGTVGTLSGRVRVIFERGATYTVSTGVNFPVSGGPSIFWMGAVGSGNRPVFNYTTDTTMLGRLMNRQVYVSDIVVNGVLDVNNTPANAGGGFANAIDPGGTHLYMRNVALRNLGLPIQFQGPSAFLSHFSLVDCEIDGWNQCGTLNSGAGAQAVGSGGYACFRGHRVTQRTDAASAPSSAENPGWNGGWGHRDTVFDVFVIDAVDGFSRSGWFANIAPSSRRSIQDVMRVGTSAGGYLGISRVAFEGALSVGTTGSGPVTANVSMNNNYFVLSNSQSRTAFASDISGVTAINTTVVIPPGIKIVGEAGIFQTPNSLGSHFPNLATTQATPNRYLNTTIVMLEDPDWNNSVPSIVNHPGNGMNVTIANTAWYRPFVSVLDEGPFDLNRAATPRMTGYRDRLDSTRGSMIVTGRSGTWSSGTVVGDVQVDVATGNLVMLTGTPSTTIQRGAYTNGSGGTGTVTVASHDHEAATATPWFRLDFDGLTAPFAIGATLTNGSASAQIRWVYYTSGTTGILWLGPITGGSFGDNNPITDNRGGSAVANGAQSLATGIFASMRPLAGAAVLGGATGTLIPRYDQSGQLRPALAARGAMELA